MDLRPDQLVGLDEAAARLNRPPEALVEHAVDVFLTRENAEWDSLSRRFWTKVRKSRSPNGCWVWTGTRSTYGHGLLHRTSVQVFDLGPRQKMAHRMAWELTRGPIPPGAHVLHRCDNPPCVRPDHLYVGDHQQNMADRKARRRYPRGPSAPRSKLTTAQVAEIRRRYARGKWSTRTLAAEFGVSHTTIRFVVTRQSY